MAAGAYDLKWFDTVAGKSVTQAGVPVSKGDALWHKPDSLGDEIAIYVTRARATRSRP
jgi:hypothetical protein